MRLAGNTVLFRLTPEGQRALNGLIPTSGSFTVLVIDEDDLGVWISTGAERSSGADQTDSVMLLKWHYFSTAVLDFRPETPAARAPVGFH